MSDDLVKVIIIESCFNIIPARKERLTKEWIENRINIFMNYTLKSLKAQTNQNFFALLLYDNRSEILIKNELEKYEELPKNVKFVTKDEFNKIVAERIKNYDLLYMVRLDCDDMYHKTFIQQLFDINPPQGTQAIINQRGYIYDSVRNLIAEFPCKSPNYYALIYNVKSYLNGERYKLPGGHDYVINLPHQIIRKYNYIRHAHSNNNVTRLEKYGITEEDCIKDEKQIMKILEDFIG